VKGTSGAGGRRALSRVSVGRRPFKARLPTRQAGPARQFPLFPSGKAAHASVCIVGEGPAWVGSSGSALSFRWVASSPFFRAGTCIGARQRVSGIHAGWGQSAGALNGRLRGGSEVPVGAKATPELRVSGWRRPSGRRHPPRSRFAVGDVCGRSLDIDGRARKSIQLQKSIGGAWPEKHR
jgi:hypothetical protein